MIHFFAILDFPVQKIDRFRKKNYIVIFSDQTLISVPAPASGPALLSIMNILEGYNFKSADRNTTQTVHRILEVSCQY